MVSVQKRKPKHLNRIDEEICDKIKTNQDELPIKEFVPRNSLLTDLLEDKHIRTGYHVFLIIFLSLAINTILDDLLLGGEAQYGFRIIRQGLVGFNYFTLIWAVLFISSMLTHFGFKFWATNGINLKPKSKQLKLWNRLWLVIFLLSYPLLLFIATWGLIKFDLSVWLSVLILMEATRFLMKMHAFVRNNAPGVLKHKHQDAAGICPRFSHYLYFLFAPTLIYRDNYPRSTTPIRWNFVFKRFLEVIGSIFFISFAIERSYALDFKEYGLRKYSWQEIILKIFQNSGFAILLIMICAYAFLHSGLNAIAEMLRFSDRLFYKDWWVSADLARYYRTWNVVVHDWLYTYIYKDFYEIITPKNKMAAKLAVFFISAVFHDYILGFAFRFYIPILFINFFGVGVIFMLIKSKSHTLGNIFLLYGYSLSRCR